MDKAGSPKLPDAYFRLLEAGIERTEEILRTDPAPTLESLERLPGCRHFPSAILMAAALYACPHPANTRQGDPALLGLAGRIGDLLAAEHAAGSYRSRLDHHRDTYMWVEAYRLLESEIEAKRRDLWRAALLGNLAPLAESVARLWDRPRYQAPFISTSPNHYALWASTLNLGARVFGQTQWEMLAANVLHRFAVEEQSPDGYWGEQSDSGPTTGYDYLTVTGVALYWEHSGDPAALEALRRSTGFHIHYTYPDGFPIETINDRHRYWGIPTWGHFGFSNFPEGRRYAQFLTERFVRTAGGLESPMRPARDNAGPPRHYEGMDLESLGRIAQNALYYHDGDLAPIPQDQPSYAHRMAVPAAIRKTGPWVVCLSGLIDTPNTNRFFLDRQAHVSVFHTAIGLIVTGANSKRQPELATFAESVAGKEYHLPISSRLDMGDHCDRLALAYNSFYASIEVPAPSRKALELRIQAVPTNPPVDAVLTLQIVLKPGLPLETGAGDTILLDESAAGIAERELGGWIAHNGWRLAVPPSTRLTWPIFPFNPYADGPETGLDRAVGKLSVPLPADGQSITFSFEVANQADQEGGA